MKEVKEKDSIAKLEKLRLRLIKFFCVLTVITVIIVVVYCFIKGPLDDKETYKFNLVFCLAFLCCIFSFFGIGMILENKIMKLKKEELIDIISQKDSLKDVVEISNMKIIFNIISNNIDRIEFGKKDSNTLVAKLYTGKNSCIYPLEISIYDFLRLLSPKQIDTIFCSLLDDIKVEKENEEYKVIISDVKGNKMEGKCNIDELMNFICKR